MAYTLNPFTGNLDYYETGAAPQPLDTTDSPTFAGLTISGLTAGRIPYISTAGLLADSANLQWDNTNVMLGIGLTPTIGVLHIASNSAGIYTADTFAATTQGSGLIARKGRGTIADPRRALNADNLGVYNARGYYAADDATTATASTNVGFFAFRAVENLTATTWGTEFWLRTTPAGSVTLTTGFALSDRGNVIIGTGVSGSQPSTGTKALIFEDGTAPATLASNTAGLYANDDGGTVKMYAIDEAGSVALLNYRSIALGGGAPPVVGTIGGSGPATATQNSWIELNIGGTAYWVPAWV